MNRESIALSHCPATLEVGTVGQRLAETGRTKWDTQYKRDKGTVGRGALGFAGWTRISAKGAD